MKPVRNNVLLKPLPLPKQTKAGIFIPDSIQETGNKMVVVAVGAGTKNRPMEHYPGEVVFRVKDWGTEVEVDGEKHFIMDSDGILAMEH